MGSTESELSLLLTNDSEIKKLNQTYRRKNKATDVLSFSQQEGQNIKFAENLSVPKLLGDVVISLPTAKRQAREYKHSLRDEILRLLVHGILHLHGYDHEHVSKAKALRMEKKELELLSQWK